MYLDILNYQKFYLSAIGKFLARRIENQLKKYCYLYDNQNIGCFGYAHPYLSFLKEYNLSISYCYSKRMGISDEVHNQGYKNFN